MIHESPYPDVEIPDIPVTEFVLQNAESRAGHVALIDGHTGTTMTYGELASGIRRSAGGLSARGFGKGDVIAIYSPNTITYPVAFHAAAFCGGVVTTVNPMYTAPELAKQLRDSEARFIVTTGMFLDKAKAAASEVGTIEEIFTFDGAEGSTPFSELMAADELEAAPDIDAARDLVALPYSSGTTGGSKGVMLTHRNLVANMVQLEGTASRCRAVTEGDTLMAVLPFYHIYGLLVIMNFALWKGARIAVLARFDLEEFLGVMHEHEVTFAHLVPPILLALAKHPIVDQYDLSSLEGIMSGAAPLGADLAMAVEERLGCVVGQGYGLTETSPVTHTAPNLQSGDCPKSSIGPAIPNTDIRIVDVDSGEDLGSNERGEVWIRGPQVMRGYLNNPAATATTIDEEGWLHTGDVGYVDDDGNFYIVDRVKELIKFRGFQVAPAELEALLLSHAQIKDVAVIRSPDPEAGEVPKAFVVHEGELSAEAVMEFVAEQVSPHKKVRRVEFVDQIPKSPSGKILRRLLVAQEEARVAGEAQT